MRTIESKDDLSVYDQDDGSPIHGDILEFILARVPLIDLASVRRVSKLWEYAVSSSLLHFNKVKPWLIIHTQCARSFNQKTVHVYDPRSDSWIEIISQIPTNTSPTNTKHISSLQSSNSSLLYKFSPNSLSFSTDPLHLTWRHVSPPHGWRVDPIVALVGPHLVVAGGAAGFDDDPLSVETCHMSTSQWSTCPPMPDILKHSTASTWLSLASNHEKLYLLEKASGITYSFTPSTKSWAGPYHLRPDPNAFFSAIGFSGKDDDIILAGIIGQPQNVKSLKLWKTKPETMEFDQIGEIPSELLQKLKGESSELCSISLLTTANFVYVYNNSDPEEIVWCEIVGERSNIKWGSVKNRVMSDERRIGERMVMSCGIVGLDDLERAMGNGNCKFLVE